MTANGIPALLQKLTAPLSDFLTRILPQIDENWWDKFVAGDMSYEQRQRSIRQNLKSLSLLDIYVLLKILDKNWYLISNKCNPSCDDRHYIKEMKSIRTRWMHSSAEGFSTDDKYRDLDTLQRFAGVIKADAAIIQEIQAAKKALIAPEIPSSPPDETVSLPPSQEKPDEPETEFAAGQVGSLKSNAEIRGAMVAVLPRPSLNRPQPNGLRILRQNGNNTSLLSIIWGLCRHPPELLNLNMRGVPHVQNQAVSKLKKPKQKENESECRAGNRSFQDPDGSIFQKWR